MHQLLGCILLIPLLASSAPFSTGVSPSSILATTSTSQDHVVAFRAADDSMHLGFVDKSSTAQDVHFHDLHYTAFTGFDRIRDVQLLGLEENKVVLYWRNKWLVYFQIFQNRSALGEPQAVLDEKTRRFSTNAGSVTSYKNEKLIFAQISKSSDYIEYTYSVYDMNGKELSRQVPILEVSEEMHNDPQTIELSVCGDSVLVAFKQDGQDRRNRYRVDNKINILNLHDANMNLIKRVSTVQEEGRDDLFTTCTQDQVFAVRKRNYRPLSYSVYDAKTLELQGQHELTDSQNGLQYDTDFIQVFSTDSYPLNVLAVPSGRTELFSVDQSGDQKRTKYDQLHDFDFESDSRGFAVMTFLGSTDFLVEVYSDEHDRVIQSRYTKAATSYEIEMFASHMCDGKLQFAFIDDSRVMQLAVLDSAEDTQQISAMGLTHLDQSVALIQDSEVNELVTLNSVDQTTEERIPGHGLWTVFFTAIPVLALAIFTVGYLNHRKGQQVVNVYKPLVTTRV